MNEPLNCFAALCISTLIGSAPISAKDAPPLPTSHTKRALEGWTVHIDDRLLGKENEVLGGRAIKLLESQLQNIALILPKDKVARLRQVAIQLDLTHGKLTPAQYHPSEAWLLSNGYSKALAKCVHIPDAKYFAEARFQRAQPWAVLHEMAHAYHDQVLEFENEEVKAAYERFVKSGKYKLTLHINGKQVPHYALTNEKEFFAEMTESYFGQNDFYPFNSAELQKEEPELFKLLAKIWGPLP